MLSQLYHSPVSAVLVPFLLPTEGRKWSLPQAGWLCCPVAILTEVHFCESFGIYLWMHSLNSFQFVSLQKPKCHSRSFSNCWFCWSTTVCFSFFWGVGVSWRGEAVFNSKKYILWRCKRWAQMELNQTFFFSHSHWDIPLILIIFLRTRTGLTVLGVTARHHCLLPVTLVKLKHVASNCCTSTFWNTSDKKPFLIIPVTVILFHIKLCYFDFLTLL